MILISKRSWTKKVKKIIQRKGEETGQQINHNHAITISYIYELIIKNKTNFSKFENPKSEEAKIDPSTLSFTTIPCKGGSSISKKKGQ